MNKINGINAAKNIVNCALKGNPIESYDKSSPIINVIILIIKGNLTFLM